MTTKNSIKYQIISKQVYVQMNGVKSEKWLLVAMLDNEKDLLTRLAIAQFYKEDVKVIKEVITTTCHDAILLSGYFKHFAWLRLKLALFQSKFGK